MEKKDAQEPSFISLAQSQELYDDHLLRLWRTGAPSHAVRGEEDEERDDTHELKDFIQADNQRPFSKDVDVQIWLDYREHNQLPKLKDTGDFVIMTFDDMNEFDVFRQEECEKEYSYLKQVQLLDLFLKESPNICPRTINKFGHTYLRFHYSEVDELIEWVYDRRKGISPNL